MAFGSNKDIIIAKLELKVEMLEAQLKDKKQELIEANETIRRTQDALVAKEAPEAYRDYMAAKAESSITPEDLENKHKQRELALMNGRLLHEMEQPMFRDAEEMMDILSKPLGIPTFRSLHGDNES